MTEERRRIGEAVNAHNPVGLAALVANYPEVADLASQCRRDFPEFYFERRPSGSAPAVARNRATSRRVMETGPVARAYCAYALDPNDTIAPDKVLFSPTGGHYDRIFKDRSIRDLIIPHIFMQLFCELHRKRCRDLKDDPSDKEARARDIIGKDIVKYYALKFVYESMIRLDRSVCVSVNDGLIDAFGNLKSKDPVPQKLMDVAEAAYYLFMIVFDVERKHTWPPDLLKKLDAKGYRATADDVPSPHDIAQTLRQNGDRLLPRLLREREYITQQLGDAVQEKLRRLAVPQQGRAVQPREGASPRSETA